MVDSDLQPLVIDHGSDTCKCGFGGDDAPRAVFCSVVGRPKDPESMRRYDPKDVFVGAEAERNRSLLELQFPIERGLVTNWNDLEKIWHHVFFNELGVSPPEHPILLTEAPLAPRSSRETMTSIMFERFNVVALYVGVQAVMSLYASGRATGLVVDSGDGVTHTVPIYEGHALPHAVRRMELAGRDVTHYLATILSESEGGESLALGREIVRSIKEKVCFVSRHGHDEEESESGLRQDRDDCEESREFLLPDGSRITIGSERFRAPEILFRPSVRGRSDLELPGVHVMCFESIQKCDDDLREELYQNIVLSGGSTMFEGMGERLTQEVQKKRNVHPQVMVNVNAPVERKFSSWIGGSMVSSLSTFQNMWVTREEYDDAGASIVLRKCF